MDMVVLNVPETRDAVVVPPAAVVGTVDPVPNPPVGSNGMSVSVVLVA
jgi:hypothetical protein